MAAPSVLPLARLISTMLETKRLLLIPVTLCFLLLVLVLPAQSEEARALVVIYGTARCKRNPSRIISNTTLHASINGTTVATGKTTGAGRFLMVANVTSRDQLMALASKKAAVVITAPPQACGMPAADAAVSNKQLADAPAGLNGHRILADSSEENLGDLVEEDITQITQILGDPNSSGRAIQELVDALNSQISDFEKDNPFDSIVVEINQTREYLDILNFLEDSGLDAYSLLETLDDFLGIPPSGVKT